MAEFVFKLPDLGEGAVEAEIVEWHVRPGQVVAEGDVIVDVMTDKANVEVPAPVGGTVVRTSGSAGDRVAVGAELAAFAVDGGGEGSVVADLASSVLPAAGETEERPPERLAGARSPAAKVAASPAVRRRAREAGIDLAEVAGSGPRGRVLERDFEAFLGGRVRAAEDGGSTDREVEPEGQRVIGVRRRIAERMAQSKREIPHFSYVEEVDVTELEAVAGISPCACYGLSAVDAAAVHRVRPRSRPARASRVQRTLRREEGAASSIRPGPPRIATHTPEGLMVPVVRGAERLDLWQLADAIRRATEAARTKRRNRSDLTGSTITITSLGRLGGLAATPIINYPEVAIVGVNKVVPRPVAMDGGIVVRTIMNLSSSFDHRFVDGFDAASFVQEVRALLEHPGAMFVEAAQG